MRSGQGVAHTRLSVERSRFVRHLAPQGPRTTKLCSAQRAKRPASTVLFAISARLSTWWNACMVRRRTIFHCDKCDFASWNEARKLLSLLRKICGLL
jgi:hypothetical protein